MKTRNIFGLALLFALFATTACKKEETKEKGQLKISIEHVFGMNRIPFVMETWYQHPRTNDSLYVETLNYYISNIKLVDVEGNTYAYPNSYHLVQVEGDSPFEFWLNELPGGEYKEIYYTLGVDSARNLNGPYTGDLSADKGMFWTREIGFMMAKVEGQSPQAPGNGSFAFRLGGFAGQYNIVTEKRIELDQPFVLDANIHTVRLQANAAQFWHAAESLSEQSSYFYEGEVAKTMADGFFGGIRFLELK